MDSCHVLQDAAPSVFFRQPEHALAREFLRHLHAPAA
jgi:hypothetical protein